MILAVKVRAAPRVLARPTPWRTAGFLFAYAVAFSLAYLRIGAATGALVLFAGRTHENMTWAFEIQFVGSVLCGLVAFWAILAHRIETPTLADKGVKGINDLSEEDFPAEWTQGDLTFGLSYAFEPGTTMRSHGHHTHRAGAFHGAASSVSLYRSERSRLPS